MTLYRVSSPRLIGRNVGDLVTSDDYTLGELDFMVKAGLLTLADDDAPKPVRRARTKTTTPKE